MSEPPSNERRERKAKRRQADDHIGRLQGRLSGHVLRQRVEDLEGRVIGDERGERPLLLLAAADRQHEIPPVGQKRGIAEYERRPQAFYRHGGLDRLPIGGRRLGEFVQAGAFHSSLAGSFLSNGNSPRAHFGR
jgi:hypothetical protein